MKRYFLIPSPSRSATCLGFTLIELILYSSLVTVIVGVFFSSMLFIARAQDRDRERHAFVENERVVSQKIDALVYGASSSQIAPSSGSAVFLQANRGCSSLQQLELVASALEIRKNSDGDCDIDSSDAHSAITNSHVSVSSLSVERVTINNQSAVAVTFTLTGRYQSKNVNKVVYIK